MLHHQAANTLPVANDLLPAILMACGSGLKLAELEQRFMALDPAVVRTAAFSLVLKGRLDCPTLTEQPLGPRSYLVAR
jgi:hypothetical protein